VAGTILLPFFVWDPVTMWRGMIANYARIVKELVWRSPDQGAIHTIGLTGWLLSHNLDPVVEVSQLCAVVLVYALAWRLIGRRTSILPWMTLALFAFSMTTVWPVYYFHFDVALLFAAAALAETVGRLRVGRALALWSIALASTTALVAVVVLSAASAQPSVILDRVDGRRLLRQGFAPMEDDGARRFSWIESTHGILLLPRSAASDADIVVTGQPFVPPGAAPQAVSAILNDVSLGTQQAAGGWQTIRFAAPASAWRIGANQLELQFPPPASPKELGLSDDPRHLAMAIQRIDVQPR
jgi:hypothetical protein